MDVEILRKVALFEGLTSFQLKKLGAALTLVDFPISKHIFKEGDIPIDGIVMAKILDQRPGSLNFIPEARLTKDGFFDNLNRI